MTHPIIVPTQDEDDRRKILRTSLIHSLEKVLADPSRTEDLSGLLGNERSSYLSMGMHLHAMHRELKESPDRFDLNLVQLVSLKFGRKLQERGVTTLHAFANSSLPNLKALAQEEEEVFPLLLEKLHEALNEALLVQPIRRHFPCTV